MARPARDPRRKGNRPIRTGLGFVMWLSILALVAISHAQAPARLAGGPYVIADSVIGAGGTAAMGRYRLAGELGQSQTGVVQGGSYRLRAGFSHGAIGASGDRLFQDGFE